MCLSIEMRKTSLKSLFQEFKKTFVNFKYFLPQSYILYFGSEPIERNDSYFRNPLLVLVSNVNK
jgi:hypothetical protein